MLGEIALAEVFVLGPQLLGDLAHRRPRQKPPAGLVGKRVLDVAGRQASRVKLDRQPLEFPRASRKRRPHARDKRFGRVADLRSRIVHCALRRLHLARPIAIPVASFLALAAFITLSASTSLTSPSSASSTIKRSARCTRSPRQAAVPNLRSSRREAPRAYAPGRITSPSGCSLRANGANREPAFLLRFRQGASQPIFQQS